MKEIECIDCTINANDGTKKKIIVDKTKFKKVKDRKGTWKEGDLIECPVCGTGYYISPSNNPDLYE